MQNSRNVRRPELFAVAQELREQHRHPHVFLTVLNHLLGVIALAPGAVADRLGDRVLVDAFPSFDAVGSTCVGQALPRFLANFVGIVWQQNIASRQVGSVLIEDVTGNRQPNTLKHVISAHAL